MLIKVLFFRVTGTHSEPTATTSASVQAAVQVACPRDVDVTHAIIQDHSHPAQSASASLPLQAGSSEASSSPRLDGL